MNAVHNTDIASQASLPVVGDLALRRIAEIADDLGALDVSSQARALAQRVGEGRFYVAVVGQFKRGKSTLIDALIGTNILPTGVVPVTAIPTVIRHGERVSALVAFKNGSRREIEADEIARYVAEGHNSGNVQDVEAVEVFVPSPLLAGGMSLVDTPGLGSVFYANTAATHAFVPHIDAAIVVIGADPPISGEELSLVETVARNVDDILVVLNKADRVSGAERATAISFAKRLLESSLHKAITPIFEVSALERLENRGECRDWPQLVKSLEQLAEHSGRRLVAEAMSRGLKRMAGQLTGIVIEERGALLRPIQDSQRRIATMNQIVGEAERSLADLEVLFAAEQRRLLQVFEKHRQEFLKQALPAAQAELVRALNSIAARSGPRFRRDALHAAQELAKKKVMPWLETESKRAEQAYRATSKRFIDLTNEFLVRIRDAGLPNIQELPENLESAAGFEAKSGFFFYNFERIAAPASPLRYIADLLLGCMGAYAGIKSDAQELLVRLFETNSMRVKSALDEQVIESRRRLENTIRHVLGDAVAIADQALKHATAVQAQGAAGVERAFSLLNAAQSELRSLFE